MSTINERIAACIEKSGLTKTAFAEKINVSQQHVSRLAKDGNPSDRTIVDICEKFGIGEHWLRTGEGEMFVPISRDNRITDFAAELLRDEEDTFKRRFVAMLSKLDESDWAVLEKMALELAGEDKKG